MTTAIFGNSGDNAYTTMSSRYFSAIAWEENPPAVYAVLKPIVDECVDQLTVMSFEEVKLIVDSVSAGYRQLLQPVERPLTREYLRRVAEYCVAVELQKGYSPVSEVISQSPDDSEVLATCPELRSRFDDDGLLTLTDDFVLFDGGQ